MRTLSFRPVLARRRASSGFSMLEVLVGLVIFMAVLAIIFSFFVEASQHAATEGSALEAQQAARISNDDLERLIRQSGFDIQRDDNTNPASWQHDLVHAGAHVLAFNADLLGADVAEASRVGALYSTQTIAFPNSDGMTYTGEGAVEAVNTGAETYVLTLDADDDDAFTLADREQADGGVYNPAADTPVPLDFAVFRRVYGWNTTSGSYGGDLEPVGGYLFTSPVDDDETRYPDGETPHPLFAYWLSEDLDGDGVLDDHECVVLPCPPDPDRKPMLYIWGDGGADLDDFDGELDTDERETLRTLPVTSGDWAGNTLVDVDGDYLAAILTVSVTGGNDVATFVVDDITPFGSGQYIRIGPADAADDDPAVELFVIDDVNVAQSKIFTVAPAEVTHPVDQQVRIHPRTLLRAVRSVELHYDAITPRNEARVPGRSGRKGTGGLDYRVREIMTKIELVNHTTAAPSNPEDADGTLVECPIDVEGWCFDTDLASAATTIFTPQEEPVALSFKVSKDGSPLGNIEVTLSNSDTSIGTLSETTVLTDGTGKATAEYTPSGTLGTDTITATAECKDPGTGDPTDSDPGTITITIASVSVDPDDGCAGTFDAAGGTPPEISFTLTASTSAGPMATEDFDLALGFAELPDDPEYPPSFVDIVGELMVAGASEGVTSGTGGFTPVGVTTDGAGTVSGAVKLKTDTSQAGVRIFLKVTKATTACSVYGTATTTAFNFNRLAMDSILPNAGCSASSRCTIAGGAAAPWVEATLTRNANPIEGATITFSPTKVSGPAGSTVSASPPSRVTNASGKAKVEVLHDNNPGVTAVNPLLVDVSASTPGKPEECGSGSIASIDPDAGFRFEGAVVAACTPEILQAYFSRNTLNSPPSGTNPPPNNRTYCLRIKNVGSCPLRILGLKQSVSTNAATMVLDATKRITRIVGGEVVATNACPAPLGGAEMLFIRDCNATLDLNNGQDWTFIGTQPRCALPAEPPSPVPAGRFFAVNTISWNNTPLIVGRKYEVQVRYECMGDCEGAASQTKTFFLTVP